MQPKTPAQSRVHTFLQVADRDIETAEVLLRTAPHLHENIGFSCQQAAEKYLKAGLLLYSLPAPFIHDLTSLATSLAVWVAFDKDDVAAATVLTAFAVEWRYETDDAPSYTSAELLAMAYRFRDKLRPLAVAFLT